MTLELPLLAKAPGELKEAHDDRLATVAEPVLDIEAYVEEFGRTIVPAYRRGIADRELGADAGLARSIIPPGTAATRDFSRLAPTIPEFIAEAYDSLIDVTAAIRGRVPAEPRPTPAREPVPA